jgi:hypothetical protein
MLVRKASVTLYGASGGVVGYCIFGMYQYKDRMWVAISFD